MTTVLIHYSAKEGPVGVWRPKEDDSLEDFYLPSVDKKWKTRGENIVGDKNPASSFEDFFDRLTSHSSYLDHFGTTESESGVPLEAVLYRVRRESVQE